MRQKTKDIITLVIGGSLALVAVIGFVIDRLGPEFVLPSVLIIVMIVAFIIIYDRLKDMDEKIEKIKNVKGQDMDIATIFGIFIAILLLVVLLKAFLDAGLI